MAGHKGFAIIGRWGLIAAIVLSVPVHAETFDERWPKPDPLEVSVWPKLEKEKRIERKVRKTKAFVCHKRYYYKRGYRYWRCKR